MEEIIARSNKDDGIFISRRLVFIMIFVSLCVNVFFLLMGILIGKDDLKWQKSHEKPIAQQTPVTVEEPQAGTLDEELSMFNEKAEQERLKPLDDSYLNNEREEPAAIVQSREKAPVETRNPESQPVKRTVSKPKPSKPPSAAATGARFWIQVLAISDKAKADSMAAKFRDRGYKVRVVPEGGFHKVRVGPYSQRAEADRSKAAINREFKIQSWVVKK